MQSLLIDGDAHLKDSAHVYVLGVFDGVHLGHQALIREATSRAQARKVGAYTFDVHPLAVIDPPHAPSMIATLPEKLVLLAEAGVDLCVVQRFSHEYAALTPEEFVERVIIDTLGAREIVIGFNYSFGRRGEGSPAILQSLCSARGVAVTCVSPVMQDGLPVASTEIRSAIASGDVERAARLLGRPHRVQGPVVRGRGVGRTIGMPTANVAVAPEISIPTDGVYAVIATWRRTPGGARERAVGVCDIGWRPTFPGVTPARVVEAHLLRVDEDLYGLDLRLEFIARLRDEIRFRDPAALRAQVAADIERAMQVLSVYTSSQLC